MKTYLLKVTFYAGSDDKEDIDTGLFLLNVNKEISESEMKTIFVEVNRHLDTFAQESGEIEFPISYENGLNIDTLMEGISVYTKGTFCKIHNNMGRLKADNYYEIEQWQ